jgi:1-acyl-sn-glycerol-3-phosphate acyltransferase
MNIVREIRRLWRAARLLAHVGGGVFTAHTLFAVLAVARLDLHGQWRAAIVRWWMRRLLVILNVRVEIEGDIHRGPVLYAANHISWLDIPCLRAAVDAAFVSKEDVRRWPVIGRLAECAGTIFLRRGERDASAHTADHMTWALAQQHPVIIFPEGTTTDGNTVRQFHARLYQAAVRTQGYVQAVAVQYTHPANAEGRLRRRDTERVEGLNPLVPFLDDDNLARHLWELLGEDRIHARLNFCPSLPAHGQERRDLANLTRAQILAVIEQRTVEAAPGFEAERIAL